MAEFKADKYIFELDAAIENYETKMKRAEQIANQLGERIEASNQKVSTSTDRMIRSAEGVSRVYWDASIKGGRWRDVMSGQLVAAEKVTKVTDTMGVVLEGVGKSADKAGEGMSRFMSPQWIARGIAMGIGWSIMQQAINLVGAATKDLIMYNVELESTLVSLRATSIATGRNYSDVLSIMNRQTDIFAQKTSIAAAMQRLMTTSLSTEQVEAMIERIKAGSVAMGYMADEQLPSVARGFKQLNPAILDNIGVNIRLDQITRKVAQDLGITTTEVTQAQIQQELFNEVIRQTEKFMGAYAEQAETAKGKISGIRYEWGLLAEKVSQTAPIKAAADSVSMLIHGWSDLIDLWRWTKKEEFIPTLIMKQGDLIGSWAEMLKMEREEEKVAEEREKLREEIIDTMVEENSAVQYFTKRLEELDAERMVAARVVKEHEDAVKRNNRAIQDETFRIRHLQDELEIINEQTREWTDKQREAERALNDINRQLERKRRALSPEEYEETETALGRIRTELERARADEERAMERVATARVEPKIFQRYKREAAEAHQKVTELTQREAEVTKELQKEIDDLVTELGVQQSAYDETTSRLERLEAQEKSLTDSIEESRDEILRWQEENWNMQKTIEDTRAHIEDKLDPAIKTLKEDLEYAKTKTREFSAQLVDTGDSADYATQKTQTLISEWQSLRQEPDIVKHVTIQERVIRTIITQYFSPFGWFQAGSRSVPRTGAYHLEKGERVLSPIKAREVEREGTRMEVTINAGMRPMRDVFMEVEQLAKEKTSTQVGGVFR